MSFIATWLNEQLQAKTADLLVEDTLSDLKRRQGLLDGYVPIKTYEGRKFLAYVTREINAVASIVAFGAEIPVGRQGNFQKITAELMKSGLTYRFDEEDLWDMKEAMELASAKGIAVQNTVMPDGTKIPGSNPSLANYIYGSIERIVKSQVDLQNALAWQVISTGAMNWTDPRTSSKIEFDYKQAGADYDHFPSALTGANAWDQYSTANGIQNLYDSTSTFVDTNGYKPKEIAMSWKLHNDLMQQTSTKNAASSLTVTQVGQVSPEMLNALLRARGLPPIVLFDEQYEIENSAKSVSKARFLSPDTYVFLTEGMGQRAIGTSLEAEGSGQSGVYVVAREIQKIPPVDAIQTTMTSLPVFANPKLLYARKAK